MSLPDPATIARLADVLARLTTARTADAVRDLLQAHAAALTGATGAGIAADNTLNFVWPQPPDADAAAIADALTRATATAFENIATFAEAERNAAQLHAVLDSVSDSYYALDRNWNFTEWSRSAEAYFKLKREDVIGRNLWDLFPAGRNQVYEDTVRAAMDKNENGRLEAPSAFNPGNTVEMRTAPMEGGISVAITDITERRRAETDARRQARQLQAVLDAAPVAIWIARGDAITGNRFAREIMRQHVGENITETVAEANLTHVKMLDAYGAEIPPNELPVLRASRGETVSEFECRLTFNDGSEVTLYGNAVPLRDRIGAAYGSVSAFADVTHLKAVERDLTNLTRDLEARVADAVEEREAALTQLHEAQKTEALGQIAGGVAHDFNNLLSPIIGGLDLLKRRGVGDDRAKRLIDGAIEAAERARTLVQRMLAFARRQPLQKSAIDITALLENLQTLLVSSVGTRVHIVIDAPVGLPPAMADANQLELALLNLALNARDAMPDGGVLTISAAAAEGNFICLSVTDTGVGMDGATLKRATEPFFSTKGVGKGTGLGLSMVHGLAGQLGGRLELSSTPGVGTTATLLLPVADSDTANAATASTAAHPRAAGRLLLVDDDAPVRESTRAMLEELGYTVTEAASANEALAILTGKPAFDWLVTDHMMPGMTGADLARAVRQRYPAVRSLIISGFAEVDDIAPDLPRLAKPFRQGELAAALASGE